MSLVGDDPGFFAASWRYRSMLKQLTEIANTVELMNTGDKSQEIAQQIRAVSLDVYKLGVHDKVGRS